MPYHTCTNIYTNYRSLNISMQLDQRAQNYRRNMNKNYVWMRRKLNVSDYDNHYVFKLVAKTGSVYSRRSGWHYYIVEGNNN